MTDKKETPRPVVKIDKSMKIRLLKACAAGELRPDDFPELFYVADISLQLMTDEELLDMIQYTHDYCQEKRERD